jgi:hypothetical protein
MKLVLTICAVVTLGGCIQAARHREVMESIDTAKNACRAQTFRTKVENARCINDAERKMGAIYPNQDLLNYRLAARIAISEKVDRKQISEAEAELEFARISADIGSQEATRSTGRRIANAQAEAASAASEIARPKTCNTYMGTTTCF